MRSVNGWAVALVTAWLVASPFAGRALAADDAAGMLESAERAFDRKQYEEAVGLCEQLVKRHPAAPAAEGAHLVWMDSLAKLAKYNEAYGVAEKMLDAYPRTTQRTAAVPAALAALSRASRSRITIGPWGLHSSSAADSGSRQ